MMERRLPAVVVLTYDYWMGFFGGDPNVVGETVDLGAMAATIVGVVQQAPHYPERTDVLVNMVTSPHHLSQRRWSTVARTG